VRREAGRTEEATVKKQVRKGRAQRLGQAPLEDARAMVADGWKVRDIAEAAGITTAAVYMARKKGRLG
jgi:hypothetical protein